MNRTEIINRVAKLCGAERYVEIGVRNPGDNFDRILIGHKIGVDPVAPIRTDMYRGTSDEFFDSLLPGITFDLIFIDGDHSYEQVFRDLINAEARVSKGGAIIMHDCLPANESEGAPTKPHPNAAWCGGAWAAAAAWLESGREGCIVDCDHGVAVFLVGNKRKRKAMKETTFMPPWQGGLRPWTISVDKWGKTC